VATEAECTGECEWVHADEKTLCDDGLDDTNFDLCDGAGGCAGQAITCTATSACISAWTPNGSDCTPTYDDGAACDDGLPSTGGDGCSSGVCTGTSITCPDTSACITGYAPNGTDCTPAHAPQDTACDDGDEETTNDVCDGAGVCAGIIEPGPCAPYCPGMVAPQCTNSPPSEEVCNTACDDLAADATCGPLLLDALACMGDTPEWTCVIAAVGPGEDTVVVPATEACRAKYLEFETCAQTVQPNCELYCEAVEAVCTDDNAISFPESCEASCADFPLGDPSATSGNSLACRIYHATVAGKSEPEVHCPHASPDGGGVCVD
jgi:hypothetical protein